MSLVTPSNLQYIVSTSVLSRVLILLLQYISNSLITDHNADAYRNEYFKILTDNRTSLILSKPYWHVYDFIEGLTKWDSQYFLEISNDGYKSEQHLAFLPLFPLLISVAKQTVFDHTGIELRKFFPKSESISRESVISVTEIENYIRSAVVGCALNNFLLFPIAGIALFALTKLVKGKDELYAKKVVWWFCFNPASIFFSACYTESLFAALTFTVLCLVEYKSSKYLEIHGNEDVTNTENYVPLSQLNRLLHICLPGIALLALSTATRSNGLVTIGFIGYQFLLKYAPLARLRQPLSIIVYITLILEFVQDILVLIMSSVIAASGYITFQIYCYIEFCMREIQVSKPRGDLTTLASLKPVWCDSVLPHPYGHVQAKYWDVGIFRYYQMRKLPNFLLASPMTYLVLLGSLQQSKNFIKSRGGRKHLPYYLQAVILTLFCSITINVEVLTRLLASSCPVVYWICADSARESRWKNKIIKFYFLSYFILGTILHTNFYPWT